jgi:hypothetical protein
MIVMKGELNPEDGIKGCTFTVEETRNGNGFRYKVTIYSPHTGEVVDTDADLTTRQVFPWLESRRSY